MRFAAIFVGLAGFASAQTGGLSGNVTDPNGDGVPTAQIQARNRTTGTVYKGVSAAKGVYTILRLPAGTYDITVPPIGFTFPKYEKKGVVVQPAQTAHLDIALVWGGNLGTPGDDISLLVPGRGSAKGPAPRGRDGKPDLSGVWIGNAPDVDQPGLLPWAEKITTERRARGGAGNPSDFCLPGDVFLVSPFIYKIIQTPSVMAILWEGNAPGITQIFLDGRAHPKDVFPSWMGDSVGRWERDTLVVDTVGFNEQSWIRVFPHRDAARHPALPARGSGAHRKGSHHRRSGRLHQALENADVVGSRSGRGSPRIHLQRERKGRPAPAVGVAGIDSEALVQ